MPERLRLLDPTNATPSPVAAWVKMYALGWKLVDGSENTRADSRPATPAGLSSRSRKKPSALVSVMPR
jgi:hypothetical protein